MSKGFSELNKTARAAMNLAQKIENSFHLQQVENSEYFLRLELQTLVNMLQITMNQLF